MASTKRLLKERAQLARDPVPYITFQDENDDDDDADMGGGNDSGIFEWKFVLELNPTHDDLDEANTIGRAADSPYCNPPSSASAAASVSAAASPKKGGILSRATRSSKSNNDASSATAASATAAASSSSTSSPTVQSAYVVFKLKFPPTYPFKPPTITVLSKAYHPNINTKTGEICDAILTGAEWGPTLNVRKVCARLRKFLCDPDPDHPLESEIAQKLVDKPSDYAALAYKFSSEHLTKKAAFTAMQKSNGRR
jgi:ubiquitin-conjugating enzyme E2 D